MYVLVRLQASKHSHILSSEIQNGVTLPGVLAVSIYQITYALNFWPSYPSFKNIVISTDTLVQTKMAYAQVY